MNVKRALALWIESKAPSVVVYSDSVKNRNYQYPCGVLQDISEVSTPVGAGKRVLTTRDEDTGWVQRVGSLHRGDSVFRLVLMVPDTASASGQQSVDSLAYLLEQEVLALADNSGHTRLVDSEASPAETIHLQTMSVTNREHLIVDTAGEPLLYRSAVTFRLTYLATVDRAAEAVIEQVITEEDDG